MTEYACWKCMSDPVDVPGELCRRCHRESLRRQRRASKSTRRTQTHDDTHAEWIVSYDEADLDAQAYRDWMLRQ